MPYCRDITDTPIALDKLFVDRYKPVLNTHS